MNWSKSGKSLGFGNECVLKIVVSFGYARIHMDATGVFEYKALSDDTRTKISY